MCQTTGTRNQSKSWLKWAISVWHSQKQLTISGIHRIHKKILPNCRSFHKSRHVIWCFFWRGKEEVWGVMGQLEELWTTFMIHPEIVCVFSKTSKKAISEPKKNENLSKVAHPFGSAVFSMGFSPLGDCPRWPAKPSIVCPTTPWPCSNASWRARRVPTPRPCPTCPTASWSWRPPRRHAKRCWKCTRNLGAGFGWWIFVFKLFGGGWFDFWYVFDPLRF